MTAVLNRPAATSPAQSKRQPPQGSDFPAGQIENDTHARRVGGEQDSQQPRSGATPIRPAAAATNLPEQRGQGLGAPQRPLAPLLWDPLLDTLAAGLDDIEAVRISQANRLAQLTRTGTDKDGEERGHGLPDDHPAVIALQLQLDALQTLDKEMTKALAQQLRNHPLHPWIKTQKGLGDKTVARLLAAIGDPYWNDLHDRPRTIGELFAFCGVAGPGQRRTRGQKANWNPDARKRLWIITGPIIRGDGPYRAVYDAARSRYADKTHTAPCAQCGKKGQPAPEGSDWRDGHKHAGAIRLVMREILRDLWTEARAIHEESA